ncbi:hypothetical protein CDAR_228161 [Caerostris darwini]|uniref:C2H2-type domain-containing protein n=1 Tax=Caerostris darwini TaxID=1538125 RepID=A0AAV4N5R7_9ARAC|nr:hypothetical protein CDAR_228161 [Caerostris darwini]
MESNLPFLPCVYHTFPAGTPQSKCGQNWFLNNIQNPNTFNNVEISSNLKLQRKLTFQEAIEIIQSDSTRVLKILYASIGHLSGTDSPESTGLASDSVYRNIQDSGASGIGSGGTSYDEDLIIIPVSCETTYIDVLPSSYGSAETIKNSNMQKPIVSTKYVFTNLGLQRVTEENATEASNVNYESKLWSPVSSASPNCPGGGVFSAGNSSIMAFSNEMTTVDVPSSSCSSNGILTMINSSDNSSLTHKQIIYLKASSRPTNPTACCPASDNNDSPPIQSTSSLNPAAKNSSKKKYACHICHKAFIWPYLVKNHVNTHFPERSYKCSLCGKSFSRLCNMQLHVREHKGERPFSCNVCKKPFLRASHLRNHNTVHFNERPFQCAVCKKSYKAKWSLKRHMKIKNH